MRVSPPESPSQRLSPTPVTDHPSLHYEHNFIIVSTTLSTDILPHTLFKTLREKILFSFIFEPPVFNAVPDAK